MNRDIDCFVKDPRLLIELCRDVIDRIDCSPNDAKAREREAQLREIAKAVENLEKMGVPVPDVLRAEKTRIAAELGTQTQSEQKGALTETIRTAYARRASHPQGCARQRTQTFGSPGKGPRPHPGARQPDYPGF
jgi:hypothetical protein